MIFVREIGRLSSTGRASKDVPIAASTSFSGREENDNALENEVSWSLNDTDGLPNDQISSFFLLPNRSF